METYYVFLGESGALRFAWALKDALLREGFAAGQPLRTDWGYLIEVEGFRLAVFPHPEEPGVFGLEFRPPGGLARLLARAKADRLRRILLDFLEARGLQPLAEEV